MPAVAILTVITSGGPSLMAIQVRREQFPPFTGPLPHPDILQQYDKVVPGAAERLLAIIERHAQHHDGMERIVVEGASRRAWYGLVLGFVLALLCLIISAALIWTGHQWPGALLGSMDLIALVVTFVRLDRSEQRHEHEEMAHPVDQPMSTAALTPNSRH
jgi:uncharacterized membrane protein